MITLKKFMETVNYRVTEGSDYQWDCYGSNAYCLDSWNGDQEGHSLTIIFDTRTQEVYEVQAHDYARSRAYRLINPEYKHLLEEEANSRGINKKEAWDDLEYVDLEVEEDWLEKAQAIVNDEDYDTRVKIEINLPDDDIFTMMKLAHERDITFNQLVEIALQEAIDNHRMLNDEPRDEYDFSEGIRGDVQESVKELKKRKKGKK